MIHVTESGSAVARLGRRAFAGVVGICCIAAAREAFSATSNFSVAPPSWQTNEFRWVIEAVFIGGSLVVAWSIVRTNLRRYRVRSGERKKAAALLLQEHERRLTAEREARDLNRRLLASHEEERSRLARELHDDITQRLACLAIDAARLETPGFNIDVVRSLRQALVRLSADVHDLAYRLHPAILEDLGLVEALQAECDRFTRYNGIRIALKSRDLPHPVPRNIALVIFRVAQEALRNVARHAHANAVELSLAGIDGGLQVAIRDDGVGFDADEAQRHPSLGLAGMRERANLAGGELDIESAPGLGTTILVWIPLIERLNDETAPRVVG